MPTKMERVRDRGRWWSIHDKDEYVCPDCGRTRDEHDRRWEVHHLDGVAGKCVALYRTCHLVRHGAKRSNCDLEAWKREFVGLGE